MRRQSYLQVSSFELERGLEACLGVIALNTLSYTALKQHQAVISDLYATHDTALLHLQCLKAYITSACKETDLLHDFVGTIGSLGSYHYHETNMAQTKAELDHVKEFIRDK